LESPLIDLVVECALRKLKECEDFKEGHAKLILRVGHDLDQRRDVAVIIQLQLFIPEGLFELSEGFLIVAADLPQQKFLLRLLILQVPQSFIGVLLQDFELVNHLLVFFVELGRGPNAHLNDKINKW
jgi:hypothetical protein